MTADELLADVRTLRTRARRDRRASAAPLLLFGTLTLLAPVCYLPAPPVLLPTEDGRLAQVWYNTDPGPFPLFHGIGPYVSVRYPGLVGWYWFLTIVLGFVATAWWYRRRAMRVGVETDTRAHLVAAGSALAGFLLGVPLLNELVPARNTLYSTPSVNLPILVGCAVVSGVVLFWAFRQSGWLRAVGLFVGVLLATVAFAAVGVYLIYGFSALLIIAAGLLVLAWLERSMLLGVIAVSYGAAALVANLADLNNMFYRAGLHPDQLQVLVFQQLLLPGIVLLVGSLIIGVTSR